MASFTNVPFNITGPTHQLKSRPLSSQLTTNLYQQLDESGKDAFTLVTFPGQKNIDNSILGIDRGTHQMNEILYKVISDRLYRVSEDGTHVSKGFISGNNRCIFADDGENLVIVSDKVWNYNEFTDILEENTNSNLVNIVSATFINSQIIYTSPELSFISQPNDPTNVSGLDGIAAESSPDKLVRDYVFNQTIYRFGKRTTEPWYNSGVGNPPIDRIDGQQFSVGLAAIYSVANTDNAIYWLGNDKSIHRVSGGINTKISSKAVSTQISKMDRIDDAFGYSFTIDEEDFYLITFPSGKKTFVINEELGDKGWFELSSLGDEKVYSATSLTQVYGKNIISRGGQLLELCDNEFTQDTDTIIRQRVTQEANSELLGVKRQRVMMSRLEIIMEQGIGLITGQGEDPRIRVEISIDGGRSFEHIEWVRLGRAGEHTLRIEVDHLESAMGFIFRLTISDPVPISIYSASIDLKLVGK